MEKSKGSFSSTAEEDSSEALEEDEELLDLFFSFFLRRVGLVWKESGELLLRVRW